MSKVICEGNVCRRVFDPPSVSVQPTTSVRRPRKVSFADDAEIRFFKVSAPVRNTNRNTNRTQRVVSKKSVVHQSKTMTCKCRSKGDEPSPKGYGYCAHCGDIGTVKIGTDRKKWVIAKRSNGSLYWKRLSQK